LFLIHFLSDTTCNDDWFDWSTDTYHYISTDVKLDNDSNKINVY